MPIALNTPIALGPPSNAVVNYVTIAKADVVFVNDATQLVVTVTWAPSDAFGNVVPGNAFQVLLTPLDLNVLAQTPGIIRVKFLAALQNDTSPMLAGTIT